MANSLVDQGVGIMVAAIVIGAVAIPVSQQTLNKDIQSVTGENHTPDTPLPTPVTVDKVQDGLVKDSETVVFYNGTDGTTSQLTKGTNYTVISYPSGEFNITSVPGYDNTTDKIQFDYEYKPDGYIGGTPGMILEYVVLALALGLFVAAISIVR